MSAVVAYTYAIIWYLLDCVIAATALVLGLPLVTRDHKILVSGIAIIWYAKDEKRALLFALE